MQCASHSCGTTDVVSGRSSLGVIWITFSCLVKSRQHGIGRAYGGGQPPLAKLKMEFCKRRLAEGYETIGGLKGHFVTVVCVDEQPLCSRHSNRVVNRSWFFARQKQEPSADLSCDRVTSGCIDIFNVFFSGDTNSCTTVVFAVSTVHFSFYFCYTCFPFFMLHVTFGVCFAIASVAFYFLPGALGVLPCCACFYLSFLLQILSFHNLFFFY